MKKRIAIILTLIALGIPFTLRLARGTQAAPQQGGAAAGGRAGAAGRLPTKDEVEVALKRNLGYDPAISWVIGDIRPSGIPGLADVQVSINKQATQHIYVSADSQNAIIGSMIPFGPNPFVQVRAKLQAADGPARGPQTPIITAVEFSDLECPHCKAAQPIVEKLIADFPQVRFVFQQFPLPATMHPWAMKAAEYADCVGRSNPEAFWKYINTVFEHQDAITVATADETLKGLAISTGLDGQNLSVCAAHPQTEARINKSIELGQSLDVFETPTMFVNGRRVLGIANIPYEQLKNIVQFEINHAGK